MAGQTFTTYINAKRSGSIDQEFAQFATGATKSLSGIQKKAEDVNRSLAGLTSGRGAAGVKSPINQQYLAGFDQAKMKSDKLAESQARLAREQSGLVRALRTTGNTLQVVQGPLGPIAGRVSAAADALVRLSGVTLGLAGAGAALFAYVRAANTFVEVRSKLAVFYDSQTQVNQAMNDIYGIAQRARAGLQPVVELYGRLKQSTDALGFSQERLGRLTELAAKAATLSGGTAQSREAGLYQFSQAIASNTLGGDELRSVKENLPALARSIAQGLPKLAEFKGLNLTGSIGDLKKLGMQGKLTADVVARALEASAGDIETRFRRLPPTLGSAFTSLGNSATMFIGRFEEATGVVGNLASGVVLLGNNLNVLVGLAGGVAAAFAAIVVAGKFKEIAADIGASVNNLRAQQTTARAGLEIAVNQRTAIAQQAAAYAAEEGQIRRNIVALEQELAVQTQLAERATAGAAIGLPGAVGQKTAATAATRTATKELADEVEHLSVVQTTAAATGRRLEESHKAVDIASRTASKSSSVFKMAVSGLLGAFNPLGIAVGLATTAFLEWAMAESQAEKNAKKVEDAQRSLATVIDFTTGRIREQSQVLLANAKLNAQQGIAAANQTHMQARSQIGDLRGQVSGQTITPEGQVVQLHQTAGQLAAERALDAFQRGGSVQQLQATVANIASKNPDMKAFSDQVTRLAGSAETAARQVGSLQSSIKIIEGTASAEDVRRAQGDFSGGRAQGETAQRNVAAEVENMRKRLRDQRYAAEVQMNESIANLEKRRSQMTVDDYIREKAQIEATYDTALGRLDKQDAAAAAKAEREEQRRQRAHERELKRIEAENKARQERTDKRTDILGRYSEEPSGVVKATRDIRELNELVGKTMNGLTALTANNPLGQGIYTAAMASQDAQNIQDGLMKPYTEYMKQRERDLEISGLIADGHDLEAKALEETLALFDKIGVASMDQYNSILQSLQAEERMNDTLAARDRIMKPLQEAADNVRNSIVSAIEQIEAGTNPLKAGRNLFKGIMQQFNAATAAQLAEKITGGLDQRVRDLIRGSTSVDTKIADYLTALNKSAGGADGLSSALSKAAAAANQAADALQNVARGAAGPGATATGAGAAADAAYSLLGASNPPSSFYKPGVKIGSGQGDNILYGALGSLGAVITENLRSQATQDALFKAGKTTARVSDHTTSQDTYDVRLPKGVSFNQATSLVKKEAAEFGYAVVKALDETQTGGTGPHAHYQFAPTTAAASANPLLAVVGAVGSAIGGKPAQIITQSIKTVGDIAQSLGGQRQQGVPTQIGPNGEIIITGQRTRAATSSSAPAGAEQVYNAIGQELGTKLDKVFGTKFISGIGAKLGTALQGAQYGQMASGVAGMLGIKQSNLGSGIGGAIGGVVGSIIPGVGTMLGSVVGGLLGGTIGGLFKKTKQASATVTGANGAIDVGPASGAGSQQISAANSLAGSVGDALQQVADQLNATIGNFAVSIGVTKKGKYVVDQKGLGRLKTGGGPDDTPEFDTEQEAIQFALMDAIKDGAIQGLSAASETILQKAKDLSAAINKVMVIESIPRRLMALKDPVRAAVMDLNDEFSKMISYLKEGGASAAQYAQAQELYDLERQKAIDDATNQSVSQIQDYLNEMLGGSSSPLNKSTVYENAQSTLQPFVTDVNAGKPVDSSAFLKAVQNFQEASQNLNGSSSSFFDDFNMLTTLLQQAKTNIVGSTTTDTSTLPPSPFDDAGIQAIINGTTGTIDAINTQTDVLGGLLGTLIGAVGGGGGTAIDLLPSSANVSEGGGGGRVGGWGRYQLA